VRERTTSSCSALCACPRYRRHLAATSAQRRCGSLSRMRAGSGAGVWWRAVRPRVTSKWGSLACVAPGLCSDDFSEPVSCVRSRSRRCWLAASPAARGHLVLAFKYRSTSASQTSGNKTGDICRYALLSNGNRGRELSNSKTRDLRPTTTSAM